MLKLGQKLLKEIKPIIAINWQGNPKHEVTYTKGRSLKLEEFSLISKSYCSLLSLQKKNGVQNNLLLVALKIVVSINF